MMAGRHQTRGFPLQGVLPGGQVHSFGSYTESDPLLEEDAEVYELRPRGKEKVRRSTSKDRLDDIIVLTKDIQEGDTLNAIALQYCCTVADIKRVNNLISDQDFFALRSIKIPVKKFSSLTETLYSPKGKQTSRPASVQHVAEQQELLSPNDSLSSTESAGSFLKEVDRDIEQIVRCTDTKKENLDEVVSALTSQGHFEPDNKSIQRKDPYYGADWGIGWWTAVVIMLIVGIITPVFYLLYYEILAKVDVSHHSTVDSSPLHSGITLPSQQREMENEIAPTNRVHLGQQNDQKQFSQDS